MELKLITKSSRSVSIELQNQEIYYAASSYKVLVNGKVCTEEEKRNVFSLYDLEPNKIYTVEVQALDNSFSGTIQVATETEFVKLDVKRFGAVGDGKVEDTNALQAAILSCPDNGTVYISKGTYLTGPLFLRSNITLYLDKEATLLGVTEREKFPILPGYTETTDEKDEYYLGSWEGNPLDSMAAFITGINVENVKIIGLGAIDGNAHEGDWYHEPKLRKRAWRPRMMFLNNCKNILVQGITVKNSPAWTIHPYFSDNLQFIDMNINNASHAPNTDGIDPESCNKVEIIGTKISVGDDCIAVKSGKLFMGKKFRKPSENFTIRNCLMERGHGAVVIGSEISGGARNFHVSQCLFKETDRGLRIKTRRGRGKDSIIDEITFENIAMTDVLAPLVINMFYFCDPDGKTEYVWSKEVLPVDDWTPYIGKLTFKDITCKRCEVAATYFYGLPEQPIKEVVLDNVSFDFKEDAKEGQAAMMSYVDPMKKVGIFANYVDKLTLKNVSVQGQETEETILSNIKELM